MGSTASEFNGCCGSHVTPPVVDHEKKMSRSLPKGVAVEQSVPGPPHESQTAMNVSPPSLTTRANVSSRNASVAASEFRASGGPNVCPGATVLIVRNVRAATRAQRILLCARRLRDVDAFQRKLASEL